MTVGIIDVGSNTIRLLVIEYEGGRFDTLLSKKIVAGLARFMENGILSPKGVDSLCESLRHFKGILRGLNVSDVRAFATASLRYAGNASSVLARVREDSGIDLELLSGEEEARLSFLGARHASDIRDGMVTDIGGASSELVIVRDGKPVRMHSLPIGCLSLSVKYIRGILAKKSEIRRIRSCIRLQLGTVPELFETRPAMLCCVGGTARAVHALSRETASAGGENARLSAAPGLIAKDEVRRVTRALEEQEKDVYRAVSRVTPERFFTILPGALILSEIIGKSGAKHAFVAKGGVREGYLLDKVIKQRLASV